MVIFFFGGENGKRAYLGAGSPTVLVFSLEDALAS